MTETTRRHGGTDAIACQVTLYRRDTYLAVKFILKNLQTEAITVDYRQTVPDDLTSSHLSFTSDYMGDAWKFEDARLEFTADIDGGEQVETVYGIKRVDIPALVDFIRYATIVATQDGTTVETVTGLEPNIEGGGESAGDATDSAGSAEAPEQQPSNEKTEEPDGESVTAPERSVEQRSETTEWETLTPEEDTAGAVDESDATAAADSHVPFGTEGEDHGPAEQDDRPPALPANRSDYILEDVRGEIESSGEFEWIDLADDANDTDDEDAGGVLGWVRSHLPL